MRKGVKMKRIFDGVSLLSLVYKYFLYSMYKSVMEQSNKFDTVVGIFLLIIAVAGNFVAETLSCQSQKLLSNNMYAKNVIILMVIYFCLGFTSSEKQVHPMVLAGKTLAIWAFFLLFNRLEIQYTMAAIIGLFVILVLKNFVDYYSSSSENAALVPELLKVMDVLFVAVSLTVIVGFLLYFKKQYKEYGKSFSLLTFIFGKTKCKSLE